MQVLPLHGLLCGLVSLNSLLLSAGLGVNCGQELPTAVPLKALMVCCVSLMWESVDLLGTHIPKGPTQRRCQGLPVICVLGDVGKAAAFAS